jgi:hypothetical protein
MLINLIIFLILPNFKVKLALVFGFLKKLLDNLAEAQFVIAVLILILKNGIV